LLFIDGEAVTAGATLFGPGQTLTYRPAAGAVGSILAFTVRAFDGRLLSTNSAVVKARFG
jgi:hypothetical protein